MSSKTEARAWWIPAGLALLALLIRLPGLNGGLWADEIYSTLYAFRTPFPEQLFEFHGDNKHPFYSLLAHFSLSVFGESPWSLRLPALLFGAATVGMLYELGRRITDYTESLFAALLLAVSYHHAWFSQNARGYSLLGFAAVVSTWCLIRVLRNNDRRAGAGFAVVIALGAYTHLTFVFAVFAQFIVALLAVAGWPSDKPRADWKLALGVFVGGGALALALYAPMAEPVVKFFLHKESTLKGVSSPAWAVGEAIRVLKVGLGGGLLGAITSAVLGLAALVGLTGLLSYWRRDRQVALLLALPVVTMLGGAFLGRGTMYPRFFFLLAGFAVLIGVRGASLWAGAAAHLVGKKQLEGPLTLSGLSLLALLSAASLPRNWRLPKQDYVGAMRFVDEQSGKDAIVATADMTTEIYGRYFRRSWHDVRDVATMDSLRRRGDVWLVYTFPRYLARFDSSLASLVERDCRPPRVFAGTVGGGEVVVCTLSQSGT